VSYVFGVGYRPEEYEQFGRDFRRRGKNADAALDLVIRLLRGEVVEHEGRRIHVTPPPVTPGGPMMMWGGTSIAAVERAARFGLGFLGQSNVEGLAERYASACREHGHEPGMAMFPGKETAAVTFVAEDLDAAWDEVGPYLLHDARSYAAWNPGNDTSAGISHATTVEELRRDRSHQIVTPSEAASQIASGDILVVSPLCGGLPPDIAWRYLEQAVIAVGA
jgi:alkanesulfonate monooxygenase SsuD/methylene tetrahydromethanopterin reductase-like flavin-dependent oxidoreductase (luciferase family)